MKRKVSVEIEVLDDATCAFSCTFCWSEKCNLFKQHLSYDKDYNYLRTHACKRAEEGKECIQE